MSTARPALKARDTRTLALRAATELMQRRGFHGFTFHDVAEMLGVSHVAIHYHFETKVRLVEAAVAAYSERFAVDLAAIEHAHSNPEKQLQAYVALFAGAASDQRLCLCGVLAAEMVTLPEELRSAVRSFYKQNEAWLVRVIAKATRKRARSARVQQLARGLLDLLEGAMVSERLLDNPSRITGAARWWISSLRYA